MIGYILYIVAVILLAILSPLFILYAIIRAINKSEYFYNVALSIDQLGNAMGCIIMNDVLLTKNSKYLFGNVDDTISYVLGMNYNANTLTIFGKLIVFFLSRKHVQKAVEQNS